MKKDKRNLTRKEFLKTSSKAAIATGIAAGTPLTILANSTNSSSPSNSSGISGTLATSILGNTGIEITKLGIGAPRIQEASVLRYALDNGVTFIDTGRSYANGKNEIMVGEVIKGKRKEFVIQSKAKFRLDKNTDKLGSEATDKKIKQKFAQSVEESLKALQTDYIDIMLFHGVDDPKLFLQDSVKEAFTKAKKEGKILACGFSVHVDLINIMKLHNKDPFYDTIMLSFNPYGRYKNQNRDYAWDQETLITEVKKADDNGTGIIAMKTCLGGQWPSPDSSNNADDTVKPSYPGAVKWVLEQPYIHGSAVAMANFQQLDEHLAVHKES